MNAGTTTRSRILDLVRQVPAGRVTSYGRVAALVGGCTARHVGWALAGLPAGTDVPWQRVINAHGRISPHGHGLGSLRQRELLEAEGVVFSDSGEIDWERFGWP